MKDKQQEEQEEWRARVLTPPSKVILPIPISHPRWMKRWESRVLYLSRYFDHTFETPFRYS